MAGSTTARSRVERFVVAALLAGSTMAMPSSCGLDDGLDRLGETMPEELGGEGKAGLDRADLGDGRSLDRADSGGERAGGASWERYRSRSGTYAADLPGEPSFARTEIDGRAVWTWSVSDGDDTYRISEFELDSGQDIDLDRAVEGALEAMLGVVEATIGGSAEYPSLEPKRVSVDGFVGRRVVADVIVDGEPLAEAHLLYVVADQDVVQLSGVDIDRNNRPDMIRFIDSLGFTDS